jgi:hypothetical protein
VSPTVLGLALTGSGAVLAVVGGWRGYVFARRALSPLLHEGEPTRTRIEALRPLAMRPRVRLFASRVVLSVLWLGLAFYGLFLAVTGAAWLA